MAMLGLVYISLCWGLMMDLFSTEISGTIIQSPIDDVVISAVAVVPPIIVFTIWINDTIAYIVGSLIGKTPLSKVSPKKTWEGTIAGILLSTALMGFIIIDEAFSPGARTYHWFLIPFIASVSGTFGDLLQSKLKRMAGVKDSGSLMPGHGGFLDRFDSLLFAIPFVWIFIQLIIK